MKNFHYESGSRVGRWAIVVTWPEGDSEYVALGTRTALFHTKAEAQEVVDGFSAGIEGHKSIEAVELSSGEVNRIQSIERAFRP